MASTKKLLVKPGKGVMGCTVFLAMVLAFDLTPSAHAQVAAPIVYKSVSSARIVRLEPATTPLALNIASRSPVPAFEAAPSPAPGEQRPISISASFGPSRPTPATRAVSSQSLDSVTPYAGPPYEVDGKWYVPAYEPNYDEVGIASWYGPSFHGKNAASGEVFDEMAMTAAHPTLPIPSLVRVTNLENGKSVIVRLNDRGPFVDDRLIDLSRAAGKALDMHEKGTARVRVQYVGPAPAEANTAPAAIQQAPALVSRQLAPLTAGAAATEPAPAADAPSRISYFLQAGAFTDMANANALRDQLRLSSEVSIVPATLNGSEFYRVLLGPWSSREAAQSEQTRMTSRGTKTVIVARRS